MDEKRMKKLAGPVNAGLLIFGNRASDPLPLYSILQYKGAMQAVKAAMILKEQPDVEHMFTKAVYPETGKYFGISGHAVERNIRILISSLWVKRRPDLYLFLGGTPTEPPPVSLFITHLALRLSEAASDQAKTSELARLPRIPQTGVESEELRKIGEDRNRAIEASWKAALESRKEVQQAKEIEMNSEGQIGIAAHSENG